MLTCCNALFAPSFFYTLSVSKPYYRRLEYGTCPLCGTEKFRDFTQFKDGDERVKILKGKSAHLAHQNWSAKINSREYCSFSNQNVYFGDFKKTKRKDNNGIPLFIQLRKNFNNQIEILNLIQTRVYN